MRFLFSLVLLWSVGTAHGQMIGWELGGWVGGSTYFGDLNTNFRLNRTGPAGGIAARYNFNDRLCAAFSGNVGYISAFDSDSKNEFQQRRNLGFRSLIFDASAQAEFNFLPYIHGDREFYFTPYLGLGIATFTYNPQNKLGDKWYNLRDYGTEGQFQGEEYSTVAPAIAYSFGFKMDFSYRWSFNVELSGRKLFTDYLDDVSGNYPDFRDLEAQRGETAVLLSDPSYPNIGEPGRQRGNGKKNDTYLFAKFAILYYFGSIRCPDMGR